MIVFSTPEAENNHRYWNPTKALTSFWSRWHKKLDIQQLNLPSGKKTYLNFNLPKNGWSSSPSQILKLLRRPLGNGTNQGNVQRVYHEGEVSGNPWKSAMEPWGCDPMWGEHFSPNKKSMFGAKRKKNMGCPLHPWKINMEHNPAGLEDHFPFQLGDF